jgi:outer membrane receptor for ferrienterochelin and colicin
MRKYILVLLNSIIVFSYSFSQTDSITNLMNMDLTSLMNVEVDVASQNKTKLMEAPAIVTVITEDDIKNSGSRDMIDVLRLVPGFFMISDVYGMIGNAMRGNYASDGKVLMLLDGQEINETLWGSYYFGDHFSVDQIKKIEVLRGPGSAMTGGFGELAVINVITKQGEDINGFSVTETYGRYSNALGHQNLNVNVGKKIKDFEFSVLGFLGQAKKSNGTYTDIYGTSTDLSKMGADLKPRQINIGVGYKGLSARFIYDNWTSTTMALYDQVLPGPINVNFKNYLAELKYDWKINEKLSLLSKVKYKNQAPWVTPDPYYKYACNSQRYLANSTLRYDLNQNVIFHVGGEVYHDNSYIDTTFVYDYSQAASGIITKSFDSLSGLSDRFAYNNYSAFAQGYFITRFFNLTTGFRYNYHTRYGPSFAPRICLTRDFGKQSVKLIYNRAIRVPNLADAQNNPNLRPENTNVFEAEYSFRIIKNLLLSANLFYMDIHKPIVYAYNLTGLDSYENYGKMGSQGIEFSSKYQHRLFNLGITYSYYSNAGMSNIPNYAVPGRQGPYLGVPQNIITFQGNLRIIEGLNLNTTIHYFGKSYNQYQVDTAGNYIYGNVSPNVLISLWLNYQVQFVKGLNVGAGVYDLLDRKPMYQMTTTGWLAPFPGPGREILVKVSYTFH